MNPFLKYTFIRSVCVEGNPDAHSVWLKAGNQSFCVTPISCETQGEAEWFQEQLATALSVIVEESKAVSEPHELAELNQMIAEGKIKS